MLVLGLTGGIASGKSTVSRILARLGAEIIDLDELVHELERPGSQCFEQIVNAFGRQFLKPDGSLDRRKLGRVVFGNLQALARLNAIVHPAVIDLVKEKIEARRRSANPPQVLVIDAPLLIEAGMVPLVDTVWVVKVDESTQMERLIARDHLSLTEALNRIRAQMPLEEKIKYADVIIDNSGSMEDTERQVRENLAKHLGQSNG